MFKVHGPRGFAAGLLISLSKLEVTSELCCAGAVLSLGFMPLCAPAKPFIGCLTGPH